MTDTKTNQVKLPSRSIKVNESRGEWSGKSKKSSKKSRD
jgi:hypothetical protein